MRTVSKEQAPIEVVQPISRVFIANRGEIARRILHTSQLYGPNGVGAVVAFSEADANSLPVREARILEQTDDRFATAYLGLEAPSLSYDNVQSVIDSAKAYGCDVVHPGYGFLAERPEAAHAIREAGLRFIGPPTEIIAQVGDKEKAREIAKRLDIPLLPGTSTLSSYEEALKAARKIEFPVMVKAQNAGGGSGNRVATTEDELAAAFPALSAQFEEVYIEKYLDHAQHIEVQIAAGKNGDVIILGERDCSAQRKFQKVIEESPAPTLDPKVRQRMHRDAIKMAKHVKYQGLGTWEFLYDSKTNKHYFLEVNPRIQVEHPVTEERTGLDLIELQFAIEEGRSLPTVKERENHVIEARIYAELPEKDFAQDSGKIQVLAIGEDVPGVRFDLAYQQGDTIPATYDKTLLKLIASGDNREQAIANIGNALKQLTITGVSTNREFLLWLISTNEFREGKITTTFIESAWKKHQRERLSKVESFLGNGVFAEYTKPVDLVPDELPQNLTYEKDGIQRNYREDITKFQEENPDASVFRFGIFEDRGVRFALGFWDFSKQKGSMGVEEGHSVVKFFEIAARDHLPAVMISNSSGARQHEGMLALIQMDFAASAYAENKHNIPTFVNIDYGPNLGGVKASISEFSDVKGAVNGSLIGLTGPDMVAETVGLEDRTQLPEGTLGVMEHLIEGRTIDIVFDNLDEAREHTMHLLYRLPGSNAVKDPSLFVPTDHTGSFTSLVPSIRYDRPPEHKYRTVVRQLFSKSISPLRRSSQEVSTQRTLTNEERLAILYHPYRPTATEYMSPDAGIFIDAVPLSNKNTVDSVDQVPPIVAAICTIKIPEYEDPTSIMVIAQETQRVRDDDGIITKKYVAQRPQDLRWTLRMMRYANKRDMPILFIADSTGADGSIEAHKGGITEELANVLLLAHELDVPIASLNIGQNGSGGGLIFSRPMNWAADLQYALSYVAHFKVQSRILKSRQVTDEEARDLLNKLNDARAERRRSMRQIDRVIPEPPGGAQNDPEFVARGIHGFVGEWLVKTLPLSASERKDDRRERTRIAASFATRPHQAHA